MHHFIRRDKSDRERRISIQVVSTSGEGFGKLDSLVSQDLSEKNVFANIQKGLSDYIKTFTKDNAAPIGFSVGPMLGLAEAEDDLWSLEKERLLTSVVDEYRADDRHLAAINAILSGNDLRSTVYTEQQLQQLRDVVDPLNDYMAQLANIHGACKAAKVSKLSVCAMPKKRPSIPTFLQPISRPTGNWYVVVDGKAWYQRDLEWSSKTQAQVHCWIV